MPNNKKEVQKKSDDKRKNDPKRIEYMKNLHKQPKHIKKRMIYNWKNKYGIISEDYDKLYDWYKEKTNCAQCNIEFSLIFGKYHKVLDHDHKSGLVRNVLCNNCNWNCNKEERKERMKKRTTTPEQKKEVRNNWNIQIICECGSSFKKSQKSRHQKSNKHLNYLSQINI